MTAALVCYTPPPLPGLPDDAVTRDVNRIFGLIREEGGEPLLPALPDAKTRSRLTERLRELQKVIEPCGPMHADAWERDPAAQAIAGMMTGFTANRRREDSDWHEVVQAYRMHLADLPAFAIVAACRDVVAGRVKDLDPDFIPSSAWLHAIAEGHAGPRWGEQHRIKKILSVTATIPSPLSPEEQSAMRDKLHALADKLRGTREVELVTAEAERAAAARQVNNSFILREWKAIGMDPVFVGDMLISVTMARKNGLIPIKKMKGRR